MGRPLLDSGARRRNSLQAYLTDKEYERVYHIAIKQDMHLSAWFRSIILRECELSASGEIQPIDSGRFRDGERQSPEAL